MFGNLYDLVLFSERVFPSMTVREKYGIKVSERNRLTQELKDHLVLMRLMKATKVKWGALCE